MHILKTDVLTAQQKHRISTIWNQVYPAHIRTTPEGFDVYLKQTFRHHHFLLLDEGHDVLGWAYSFDRDGERWFSILLDKTVQRQGWGTKLLDTLKQNEEKLCGWAVDHDEGRLSDGDSYISPIAFYERHGFEVNPHVRFESGDLSAVKVVWINSGK